MKLLIETANDFVLREVEEWGWDYVDEKFASGYEPTLINGVWCWYVKSISSSPIRLSNPSSSIVPNSSSSVLLVRR